MKPARFIIPLVVYPFDIIVLVGDDTPRHKKYLIRYLDEEDAEDFFEGAGKGRTVHYEGKGTVIYLRHYPQCPETMGIMSHEIFHAVSMIFEYIGITHSKDSDEAYAYLIGYLTGQILRKLKVKIVV